MRSPKDPVTGPSTGQRFGAEFARIQSAGVLFLVKPSVMPAVVAPVRAAVLSVYRRSSDELSCGPSTLSEVAALINSGSCFRPYRDETSLARDPNDAT